MEDSFSESFSFGASSKLTKIVPQTAFLNALRPLDKLDPKLLGQHA